MLKRCLLELLFIMAAFINPIISRQTLIVGMNGRYIIDHFALVLEGYDTQIWT